MTIHWLCPLCEHPLNRDGQRLLCANNHSFDIAKRGYVNLLPIQQKRAKDPGDNKAMVQSRTEFLHQGFYRPMLEKVLQIKAELGAKNWIDAGCGEGWYTAQLYNDGDQGFAFDISRHAVHSAARLHPQVQWAVASVVNIPLPDDQFDMILSVFSRVDENEFHRLLHHNGRAIFVGPGSNHLIQLRQAIYQQVRDYQVEKQLDYFAQHFTQQACHSVQFDIQINTKEQLHSLLAMTPHGWKTSQATVEAIVQTLPMQLSCDFNVRVFKPNDVL